MSSGSQGNQLPGTYRKTTGFTPPMSNPVEVLLQSFLYHFFVGKLYVCLARIAPRLIAHKGNPIGHYRQP